MSEIKFKREKERYKILIIVILISFSCFLMYYLHVILGTEVVFSYFFYIPIILASLWWKRKGLVVAVSLALLLVLSRFLSAGPDVAFVSDLLRASMFIVVAAAVAMLSERMTKAEAGLREYAKNLEETVEERTKEIKKLSEAVKASTESIVISDLEGKITDVNEATLKMYGTGNKGNLVGKSSLDLIAPEDREKAFAAMKEVMEKGYVKDQEFRIVTKNGSKLPVEMSVAITKGMDGEPKGFVGISRDITERKKTEEALVEERNLLRAFTDNTPDWIFFKDTELRFVRVNRAHAQLLGVADPKEALGKTDLDFFPRKIAQRFYDEEQKIIQSREPVVARVGQTPNRDGKMLWVSETKIPLHDETGKLVGLVGISRDVTKLKKAEEELQESEERYRFLYEKSLTVNILVAVDGKIIDINETAMRLFGYKKSDVIGKETIEFVVPEQREKVAKQLAQELKGEHTPLLEVDIIGKKGIRTLLFSEGHAMILERGKLLGILLSAIDITERKEAEEALIRSEKLKALGEMAAGVAHDFNNLLAIILGNAQLLERGMERYKSEEIKDRLKIIARTAHEGGETVRRLQHFSQREVSTEDFTKLDLNKIVREAIASTSPRWKDEAEAKGIRIRIKEELGELPPLLGSRSELMEVFTNLIFNALDSMSEGGEITIRTEAKEGEVLLYFTDTGKGIPKRIRNKIFDPFFTTKGPKASGLGLSICYGIIKRHRGKIKVQSSKGKGTTFTISMPVRLESKKR